MIYPQHLLSLRHLQFVLSLLSAHRLPGPSKKIAASRAAIMTGRKQIILDERSGAVLDRSSLTRLFVPSLEIVGAICDVRITTKVYCTVITEVIDAERYEQTLGGVVGRLSNNRDRLQQQLAVLVQARALD